MAPEQALGNPMDGRADLYAAAVLGYEMLCGQPPFYSEDKLEVMSMHTARPVPAMRQRMVRGARPVPASLERLIARGLTKKPGDRYATAEDFLAEVEHALRTPDGGATDVVFDRRAETGSEPLLGPGGEVRITGAAAFAPETGSEAIADAISDALSTPNPPARALAAAPPIDGPRSPAQATPKGGVGLGLPYTGPLGEPRFGMSPEQRLGGASAALRTPSESGVASALEPDPRAASVLPRSRRRLWLYAAIAATAIAAGVAGAVITASAHRGGQAIALDPASPAGAANEAFEHGDVARALQILEASKAALATDATAQLVLGHVRAARNESGLALAAYDQALRLQPDLEANEKLRAALRTMAGSRQDYPMVAQAFDLWVGRTTDPEAIKLLLLAAVHDDIERRKAVRPVIERRKLGDHVDWLAAYSLDLEQDTPCEARREAVSKLRALGDARAVEALERAKAKLGKSGAYRGKRINGCLIEDATAAIGYLRGLPKK